MIPNVIEMTVERAWVSSQATNFDKAFRGDKKRRNDAIWEKVTQWSRKEVAETEAASSQPTTTSTHLHSDFFAERQITVPWAATDRADGARGRSEQTVMTRGVKLQNEDDFPSVPVQSHLLSDDRHSINNK
ncbi:unnamed protein product [Heligmosomoides polygyrus]|uniref:MADF domain-containing protein n=1 Tax=Heligmosomoides polygyrus TaxID=6339 RepID=A0A183FN48_HELPZ|nr:unnamed protein product [Heligmosomoides polygyrus]